MASRENQGLQIATIVVSVLAVIFAVTTYVFYAQSTKNQQAKALADDAAQKVRAELAIANHKVKALQYVIGDGGVTLDQVNESAPAGDPDTKRILDAFNADMLAFGDAAGVEGPRNYRTLPVYLLSAISNKNTSVVTANNQATEFQKEKDNVQTTEQQRAAAAEAAVAKAQEELKTVSETSAADLDAVTKEREKLAAQLVAKDKANKTAQEEANKQIAQLQGQISTVQSTLDGYKTKLANTESEQTFENPDGRVTWVNQKQQLAWINVGRADGLIRQATFSVFDPEANGLSAVQSKSSDEGSSTRDRNMPRPKGTLEVVRIIDDHLAECRISGDSASNPILPNDVIYSPLWSPGQQIHFALAGFMDIDGDGISDREMIRNIITMNNGVIDAEIKDDGTRIGKGLDVNTRYIVEGAKPTEKNASTTGPNLLKEFTSLIGEGQRYGTETLSVQKLLVLTGWKSQEQTVKLGTSGSTGSFKRRTPGGAKPAPAAAPAAEADAGPAAATPPAAAPAAATEEEPAAMAEDPFK